MRDYSSTDQLLDQTDRQLPDQSTTLRAESSLAGDPRLGVHSIIRARDAWNNIAFGPETSINNHLTEWRSEERHRNERKHV